MKELVWMAFGLLVGVSASTLLAEQTEQAASYNLVCRDQWGTALVRYETVSRWSPEGVLEMNVPGQSFSVICTLE